jgi:hypothetical protein
MPADDRQINISKAADRGWTIARYRWEYCQTFSPR